MNKADSDLPKETTAPDPLKLLQDFLDENNLQLTLSPVFDWDKDRHLVVTLPTILVSYKQDKPLPIASLDK